MKLNAGVNIFRLVSDVVNKKPIKLDRYIWVNITQSTKLGDSSRKKK